MSRIKTYVLALIIHLRIDSTITSLYKPYYYVYILAISVLAVLLHLSIDHINTSLFCSVLAVLIYLRIGCINSFLY